MGQGGGRPIWMVAAHDYVGSEQPTFGPFASKDEAESFAAGLPNHYVYNAQPPSRRRDA